MSKMAQLNSRKFKHVKDSTRMIICEQAFDVRDGDLTIAVYHPESKTTFAFLCETLPLKSSREYDKALRKAIWSEALKHIPSKSEPTDQAAHRGTASAVMQPGLFG